MKKYLKPDAWNIIEEGLDADLNEVSESCFSLGNGKMGHRAFFEEHYSGPTFQGCYLAGVSYAKKIAAAKPKVGQPATSERILNAPNWVGIDVHIDGEMLDLNTCRVKDFSRTLNMKEGLLERSFTAKLLSGKEVKVTATRFCSMASKEVGAVRYSIKALNFEGNISLTPFIDGERAGMEDAEDGPLWTELANQVKNRSCYLLLEVADLGFRVSMGMKFSVYKNNQEVKIQTSQQQGERYAGCTATVRCKPNDEIVLFKYASIVSSLHRDKSKLLDHCQGVARKAYKKGFDKLLKKHTAVWAAKWELSDVTIEGDLPAQQGIRFSIFQLHQSYSGEDDRISISREGFSGEQFGGHTCWEAEAFCLPFFMATAGQSAAQNLLRYRYNQLPKAIEQAEKLGFKNGAALFPAATIHGNESELDFEKALFTIHRNGTVAYAIHAYVNYTGDVQFLVDAGLEVLVAIARFWAQRVHWSQQKQHFVLHGVAGPNEYEQNVDNNWYTNYLATWCLQNTLEAIALAEGSDGKKCAELFKKLGFDRENEVPHWQRITAQLYLPKDEKLGVLLQQENFLDKNLRPVSDLTKEERPLIQSWSWDRLLRSCFIEKADVLQGLYLFQSAFAESQIRRNYDFYEPMTLHESCLSACPHAILAARLGYLGKAHDYFTQAVRLDLDMHRKDTEKSLHITSMAGNWLILAAGFGGFQVCDGMISFDPLLPAAWTGYSFKLLWRGHLLEVKVSREGTSVLNHSDESVQLKLAGRIIAIPRKSKEYL
ncbi:MAG: family 65 glycosyl hydrolase domain-containing protein [Saprospiraceae bacterium]